MIKSLFFTLVLIVAFPAFAQKDLRAGAFVTHEWNATDRITSVGISHVFTKNASGFIGEVNSSFGYAEVLTESDIFEEYPVWESGVKLGYYSTLFVYIEAGIDLAELALDHDREDCCIRDERINNQIDGYAGIGAGINLNKAKFTLFVRARQIDSNSWESKEQVFAGASVELKF